MGSGARAALVTGAANGIGRAIALRLRDDGFAVAATDIEVRDADGPESDRADAGQPGDTGQPGAPGSGAVPPGGTQAPGELRSYVMDVADLDAHDALLDRVERELGPVTALVNVAGIFVPESVEELTIEAYRRQHAVMLDGPVWLARAAGVRMARRGFGRIVNVTSVHGTNGEPGSLSYDTAKAGLEAATRTMAIELGPRGVLVNSVAPGFVRTRLSVVNGADELESDWFRQIYLENGRLPLRRAAEPYEIAATVSHLVSTDNTYLTGQRVVIDGGLLVTF
jgi:NAD(P)-dependent dehydrogenase (short-subunit alcohol dehydrogenase family)